MIYIYIYIYVHIAVNIICVKTQLVFIIIGWMVNKSLISQPLDGCMNLSDIQSITEFVILSAGGLTG